MKLISRIETFLLLITKVDPKRFNKKWQNVVNPKLKGEYFIPK